LRTIRVSKAEFDASKKIRETDDELIVPTIFTREAILPFDKGKGYRSASELKDAAWTLEGSWIVGLAHIDTIFVTDRLDIRGRAQDVKFCDEINAVIGDSHFFKAKCDPAYLARLKKGDLSDVSVSYYNNEVFQSGKFGDEPYDFQQKEFMFGHIAAGVPEGRCPSPFCGMSVDALLRVRNKDPEETENYIHLPVRDKGLFTESMRTITLSEKEGILAVIGKLKEDPEGSTKIQKYLFKKDKDWTMEKAQAWVKEHKDRFDVAEDLNAEALKAKIQELSIQREAIREKLWPTPQRLAPDVEKKLQVDLSVLDSEIQALTEVLAHKLAGVKVDCKGCSACKGGKAGKDGADVSSTDAKGDSQGCSESVDPQAQVDRSRQLLKSPRFR